MLTAAKESSATSKTGGAISVDNTAPSVRASSFQLVIKRQPPNYVYIGEPFPIDVVVVAVDSLKIVESTDSAGIMDVRQGPYADVKHNSSSETPITATALNDYIGGFDIYLELLAIPNNETVTPMTATSAKKSTFSSSESKSSLLVKSSSEDYKPSRDIFMLDVLQNPSSVPVGIVRTIRCSIRKNTFGTVESCRSSTNKKSEITFDDSQMLFQIRIDALRSDDNRNRRKRWNNSFNPTNNTSKLSEIILPEAYTKTNVSGITSATNLIAIVRHKILITSCSNDGTSHSSNHSNEIDGCIWNPVWYKDEGGREKCMEVVVGVYDCHHVALLEAIPLLLILCYAATAQQQVKQPQLPIPVSNQDILRILSPKPNQRFFLDGNTGTMKIRFRVEDVSKNHQGQDFCLLIAAALDDSDDYTLLTRKPLKIAPAVSLSINIRSKRNKRPRQSSGVSSAISVPASDVSSEHITLRRAVVPPTITHSTTNISATELLKNLPSNVTLSHLQDAVQNVVYWAEDVVSAFYEIQRNQLLNDSSTVPLVRLLDTYHYYVRGHFESLQQVFNFETCTSTERAYMLASGEYRNSQYSSQYSPYFYSSSMEALSGRFAESRDFVYSNGQYQQSSLAINENAMIHHVNPYYTQNPHYYPLPDPHYQRPYGHIDSVSNTGRPVSQEVLVAKQYTSYDVSHQVTQNSFRSFMSAEGKSLSHATHISRNDPPLATQYHTRKGNTLSSGSAHKVEETFKERIKLDVTVPSEVVIKQLVESKNINELDAINLDTREDEVEYIFAKQFKSLRTGALLGYPAYSVGKELIGFYQQTNLNHRSDVSIKAGAPLPLDQSENLTNSDVVASEKQSNDNHIFIPISEQGFGMKELEKAKDVLEKADRAAVQSMSQYGSIEAMLHRAIVYEWGKGLHNESTTEKVM